MRSLYLAMVISVTSILGAFAADEAVLDDEQRAQIQQFFDQALTQNETDLGVTPHVVLADPVAVSDEGVHEESSLDRPGRAPNSDADFDMNFLKQELMKILAEHHKNVLEQRMKMRDDLPEECRQAVIKVEEMFPLLVEKININQVIMPLCSSVQEQLASGALWVFDPDTTRKDSLSSLLLKLEMALDDKSFLVLLDGADHGDTAAYDGMVAPEQLLGMMNVQQQMITGPRESHISREDLAALICILKCVRPRETQGSGVLAIKAVQPLVDLLQAIVDRKPSVLTKLALRALETDFAATYGLAKRAMKLLQVCAEGSGDSFQKKAADFWLRTMRRYTNSLTVFNSLQKGASFDSARLSHNIFTLMARSYDLAHGFLKLYVKDNHPGFFTAPVVADWALCGVLASWHFMNVRSDVINGELVQLVLGNTDLASLSPSQLMTVNGLGLLFAMPVLFSPTFWNQQPSGPAKALQKVVTAFLYYLACDADSSGCKSIAWPVRDDNNQNAEEGLNAVGLSCDRHMKPALWYAITEATKFVSLSLEHAIAYNANPQTLEDVDTYTMGIVRPQAVRYLLFSLVPLVLLRNALPGISEIPGVRSVVAFNRREMYGNKVIDIMRECAARNNLTLPDHLDDDFFIKCKGNTDKDNTNPDNTDKNNFDIDALFLEYMLMDYVLSSVGGFWGRKLAHRFKDSLINGSSALVSALSKCLYKIGLLSADELQDLKDFKEGFVEEFEFTLLQIKAMARSLFIKSPVRDIVIPLLVKRGYLDEDETNPVIINRVLIYHAVNFLARNRMLTYFEATKIVHEFDRLISPVSHQFDKHVIAIDKIIDLIADGISANLFGAGGEWIGSVVGSQANELILRKYGPIYPRLRAALWSSASPVQVAQA